jgi:glyoxylase-like metal-dependent hydrolase (beta-lactamase superfamily II)
MRNVLRAMWVVIVLGVLLSLLYQEGAAQQAGIPALRPPMPPNLFTVHKLTDKLYVIAPYGPDMSQVGGNIGVFITDEGVLVVDDNYYRQVREGKTVELAEAVVTEIRKLTKQPIRFIVNTHHHSDHAGGNPVFAKLGTIVAQKNVRNRILAGYKGSQEPLDFDPAKAAPIVTYDGELAFFMGGEEIHLYHPARAHTDGDTLVHFKNANVALWGDTFINNWVPNIDVAGGASTLEWLQFIDRGIQLVGENAMMVPGHGAIGRAADVRRFRQYFTNMHEAVRKAIGAGKTREQTMDDVTVPAYANLPGGAARIRMNVAAVYDELKARP